jgi:hypothetical protein
MKKITKILIFLALVFVFTFISANEYNDAIGKIKIGETLLRQLKETIQTTSRLTSQQFFETYGNQILQQNNDHRIRNLEITSNTSVYKLGTTYYELSFICDVVAINSNAKQTLTNNNLSKNIGTEITEDDDDLPITNTIGKSIINVVKTIKADPPPKSNRLDPGNDFDDGVIISNQKSVVVMNADGKNVEKYIYFIEETFQELGYLVADRTVFDRNRTTVDYAISVLLTDNSVTIKITDLNTGFITGSSTERF